MPLITQRDEVIFVYQSAADAGWVVPTFCAENHTTIEAVLSAAKEHGQNIGREDVPVTLAITNLYSHRSQTTNYTHTRDWATGLKLFLADIGVLAGVGSPFEKLRIMVHLDHIQPDLDNELLKWDMGLFSSIMFDASALPFEQNMESTRKFVEARGREIVIEGACDEIVDATGEDKSELTTPKRACEYIERTGVDFIVANLGTEHRASAADLKYHGDLARSIREKIGPKIVLHGCSSVPNEQVRNLFGDGVCKVNIWTALERDSSPSLLRDMVANAAKVAGPTTASELAASQLLGPRADLASRADLSYFTTLYRQAIVFEEMKRIAMSYLGMWYV